MDDHDQHMLDQDVEDHGFILGDVPKLTKDNLLSAIPSRTVVDGLVYRYFNSIAPCVC